MSTEYPMTINVQMSVSVSVYVAEQDGEVSITSVRGLVGLPTAAEVMEAMQQEDFDAMDEEFAALVAAGEPA